MVSLRSPACDLAQRLLVVLRDVRVDHDAPLLAVGRLAVLGRGLLGDLPLLGHRLRPAGQAGADRQHAHAMLPAAIMPKGVMVLATAISKCGSL
jgi:hypothetical protein